MKKVRLYESFHGINEAKRGTIHKAVKAGDYPVTIVVIENGKVIKQEIVNTAEAVPATFNVLQKEYPNAKLHVEDRGGQMLFVENLGVNEAEFNKNSLIKALGKNKEGIILVAGQEYVIYNPKKYSDMWDDESVFAIDPDGEEVEVRYADIERFDEAYDGNMADFKYEFPQVFADVTGNPEKAIKKIKKSGKGFEVRTSAYMSEEEMEEVASALGMVLVDYEKNSSMAISVFESVVNESEWVAYISYPRGKKLVKTLKSHRAAVMWNNKNVDSILMQDDVEGVGIMSREMWDENEAEWAIESVVTEGRSIRKIQNEYDKVVQNLLDTKESWKDCKESGDAKGEAKCLAELKELTAKKKALMSELDDVIGLKDIDAELAESVNESIMHGSYYFSKASVSSDMQPTKGETKYAVICHNTVQMGKNIMYLKGSNSKIGQNFEAHVLSVHDTEEEAFEAYKNALKYDEGATPNHVSYAYGTLTSKGSNLPFDEIGGERKIIK